MTRFDLAFPSPMNIHIPGLTIEQLFILHAMHGYIAAGSTGMPAPEDIADLAIRTANATLNRMSL